MFSPSFMHIFSFENLKFDLFVFVNLSFGVFEKYYFGILYRFIILIFMLICCSVELLEFLRV